MSADLLRPASSAPPVERLPAPTTGGPDEGPDRWLLVLCGVVAAYFFGRAALYDGPAWLRLVGGCGTAWAVWTVLGDLGKMGKGPLR